MNNGISTHRGLLGSSFFASVCFWIAISPAFAQQSAPRDPAEPQQGQPHPKVLLRPAAAIARQSVDEKSMRALIDQLVSCGTRLSLSSWTDAKRGIARRNEARTQPPVVRPTPEQVKRNHQRQHVAEPLAP